MKEHPISFRREMLTAVLDNVKTETRRVVKPSNSTVLGHPVTHASGMLAWWDHHADWRAAVPTIDPALSVRCKRTDGFDGTERYKVRPRVYAGDRLWTKGTRMQRKADANARLLVVEVRVQRLRDVTAADVLAEGITYHDLPARARGGPARRVTRYSEPELLMQAWRHLWDSINGDKPGCAWRHNPWVWVYRFRRAV